MSVRDAFTWIGLVAVLAVGFAAGWTLKPDTPAAYRTVEVPVGPMLKLEPKIETGWIKKAWYDALAVERRRIARGGGQDDVREFCSPLATSYDVTRTPTAPLDTVPAPEFPDVDEDDLRAFLTATRVTRPWLPWRAPKIDAFGVTNEGDRFHDTYKGWGTVETGTKDGRSWAEGERLGWLKPLAHVGIGVVGGFGIGRVTCP